MQTSRGLRHVALRGIVVALALSSRVAHAQWPQDGRPSAPSIPPAADNRTSEDEWHNRELMDKLKRTREKDRQKRIVDDANRLVELTAQYRRQLAAHETPTAEDQKLLVDIEKLAREVKDRMRGY